MAYQILDLTLINGSDFKVSFFSCTRVYAIASISCGDSRMRTHNTYVDYNDCRNPMWNAMFHFPIPASATPFFGHRDVGEVFVPFNDLFVNMTIGGDPNTMSYPVRWSLSSRDRGVLYFSYNATKRKENQYVKNSRYCEVAMAKAMVHASLHTLEGVPYGPPYMVYPPKPYGYVPPTPYMYTPPSAMYMYIVSNIIDGSTSKTREGWEWG
ncbi:hypothetical protein ZWY2020_038463 [Hordeum vulgare]|nr:hypothetical protein ZWY2020_038463 [Hordeum vulgare]